MLICAARRNIQCSPKSRDSVSVFNSTEPDMKAAYTVTQFCDDHNLSRTHLYELIRQGLGPRLMKVGRRTLISIEAAADWRRKVEQATAETHREAA